MTGDEAFRSEPRQHRVEQHLVQIGAVDRKVRPLMAGRQPPRLAVDKLAVAREEGVILRLAGDRGERILQAERAQFLDRMRSEIDADAERTDLRRRLENSDSAGHAGCVDGQRQRQAANAAANDDHVHRAKLSARARAGNAQPTQSD